MAVFPTHRLPGRDRLLSVTQPFRDCRGIEYPATRPVRSTKLVGPLPPHGTDAKPQAAMSEIQAIKLARDFKQCDDRRYRRTAREVEDLINEGYTPEEALMLSGIDGYCTD